MRRAQWNQERLQTAFVLMCGLLVTFCLQIVKFDIFPQKYFYDASAVQTMIRQLPRFALGDSYGVAAWVFHILNQVLPMDSQVVGGLTIWMILVLPCGWLTARSMRAIWSDYILFALYCVLLPIFVWNTHKETLQFFFFFILAICIIKGNSHSHTIDVLTVSLLLLWGLLFRSYYLIIAVGTAALLLLYYFPWERTSRENRKTVLLLLLLGAIIILLAIKMFRPQLLVKVFESRTAVNQTRMGSSDANTILLDLFENEEGTIVLYLVNYGIAAVRMLFPFELIFKGAQYLPFIGLQLFWNALLLRRINRVVQYRKNGNECIAQVRLLAVLLSWYLVSFLFEPDFGSFVRHQVAVFPVAFPLYVDKMQESINT